MKIFFSLGNNFLSNLRNVTIQPNKSLDLFMDSFVKQRNNKFCVFPNPSLDTHTVGRAGTWTGWRLVSIMLVTHNCLFDSRKDMKMMYRTKEGRMHNCCESVLTPNKISQMLHHPCLRLDRGQGAAGIVSSSQWLLVSRVAIMSLLWECSTRCVGSARVTYCLSI